MAPGSAGWWDIDRVGRDAARAPGRAAYAAAFGELLPPERAALAGLTAIDQPAYREITEVRCLRWWVPGTVVIGDAAQFLGPEAGLGAGLGLSDALALATAIAANPKDPDAGVHPLRALARSGGPSVRGARRDRCARGDQHHRPDT